MTTSAVCGYRLTEGAQQEMRLRNLSHTDIARILRDTVDQEPVTAVLWSVTDGRNTAIISPITSVIRGSRKKAAA